MSYDINNNIVSDTYTWTKANGTGSANLSVDKLTGALSGTVTITATSNTAPTKSSGKVVTVVPGAIAAITVAGSTPITSGIQSSSYTATSTDAAGNLVSDTYTWSKLNGTGSATLTVDKLTGTLIGTVTITATSISVPSKSGNSTLTVVPGAVANVTVSGTAATALTCNGWNGTTGGVLAFRATGTVTTNSTGYISAYGVGHRGGAGTTCYGNSQSGESYIRPSYASGGAANGSSATAGQNQTPGGGCGGAGYSDNGVVTYTASGGAGTTGPAGGGGGGLYNTSGSGFYFGGAGAGGGYGSEGQSTPYASNGSSATGGAGGTGFGIYGGDAGGGGLYGSSTTLNTRAYFGAGGGAGGGVDDEWNENLSGMYGGAGGGLLFIGAETITSAGYIIANGGAGGSYYDITYGFSGLGGGGAGGSVLIRANNITNSGTISANGALGGSDGFGNAAGTGGAGRIYYQSNGYSGNTPQTRNGSGVNQSTYYYAGPPNE